MNSVLRTIIFAFLFPKSLSLTQTPGRGRFTSLQSCAEIIATHEFEGTCCSVSDSDDGGCVLIILGGYCIPTGPVWSRAINSTSTSSCPVGQYQVLPTNAPTFSPTTERPTIAPVDEGSPTSPAPEAPGPTVSPVAGSPAPETPGPSVSTTTGNPTASVVVPSTPEPTPVGGPSCRNDNDCPVCPFDCPPEFCGTDGNCYEYTCENFFRFHRDTEFDGSGDSQLVCDDVESDIHLNNYGCDIAVGELATPPSVGMKATRACFGMSKTGVEIVSVECYDLNGATTDYDAYAQAANSATIVCDDVGPFFFYSASYEVDDVRSAFTESDTVANARATSVLDPVKASESMFGRIYKDLQSGQPTSGPTVAPSVASNSPSESPSTQIPSFSPSAGPTIANSTAPTIGLCKSDDDCPEQFCGMDGFCYDYSCDNFFRWHPVTEFDGTGDNGLTCEPRSTQLDIINYGCTKTVGSTTVDGGIGVPANQVCVGKSRDEGFLVTVECFNLAMGTDFTFYVAATEDLDLTCQGALPEPRYFYGVGYTRSELVGQSLQSSTLVKNGARRTDVFDESRAYISMFAVVVREPVTASPTSSPSASPTDEIILKDISAAYGSSAFVAIVTSISIGVLGFVLIL